MDNQAQRIYAYMEVYGSITSMDAFRDLGITRLSARIKDMRDIGIEIETIMEHGKNSRYARYYLRKEQSSELGQPLLERSTHNRSAAQNTQHYDNRKDAQMQEVTLRIHNILDGDEPPEDGYYLVVITPEDEPGMIPYYWLSEKHAWKLGENEETLLMPFKQHYSLWCEADGLKELIV